MDAADGMKLGLVKWLGTRYPGRRFAYPGLLWRALSALKIETAGARQAHLAGPVSCVVQSFPNPRVRELEARPVAL